MRSWRAEDEDGKQPWLTVGRIRRARRGKDARERVSGPRDSDGAEIGARRHRWEVSCHVAPANESTARAHKQKRFDQAVGATIGRREPQVQVGGGRKGPNKGGRFISCTLELCHRLSLKFPSSLPPQPFSLITPEFRRRALSLPSSSPRAAVLLFDLCFTKTPGLEVAWQRRRRRIPQRLRGGGQPKLPSKWGRDACWVFSGRSCRLRSHL